MDILMRMMRGELSGDGDGYRNLIALADSFIRFSGEYPDYFNLFVHFESSRMENLNIDRDQIRALLARRDDLLKQYRK